MSARLESLLTPAQRAEAARWDGITTPQRSKADTRAHYAAMAADAQASLPAWAIESAAARLLADVESFVEGLDISDRTAVDSDWATRIPGRLTDSDDATVMHAAMVAADRGDKDTCTEAMGLLVKRYLKRRDHQLRALAGEAAA